MTQRDGSQNAYCIGVGVSQTNYPIIDSRDPIGNDVYYNLGRFWINKPSNKVWYLNSQSNNSGVLQANWQLLNAASSAIITLSDTSGTIVNPSSISSSPPSNIQLIGGTGVTVVAGTNSLTISSTATGAVSSVTGNNGVTASPTTGAVVVSGVNATNSTVGVASFNSSQFTVNSGAVSLTGSGTVTAGTNINISGTNTVNLNDPIYQANDSGFTTPGYSFASENNAGMGFAFGQLYIGFTAAGIVFFNDSSIAVEGFGENKYLNGMILQTLAESANYTTLKTDNIISVTTSGGPITITLGTGFQTGHICYIKDATGNAGTNNLTISGNGFNIDGSATLVLNYNYAGVLLEWNGTQWNALTNYSNNSSASFVWTDITTATQAMAVNNGYVTNRSAGVTYTLPSSATEGNIIEVSGKLGAWTIAQNAGQQILVASGSSTAGTGGSVASSNVGDCIRLLCITGGSSTIWRSLSHTGNLTLT